MFYVARTTQNAVSLKKERKTSESAMAWRMTLLVMTDAACWVPIITLGLLSVAGLSIPPQVRQQSVNNPFNAYFRKEVSENKLQLSANLKCPWFSSLFFVRLCVIN